MVVIVPVSFWQSDLKAPLRRIEYRTLMVPKKMKTAHS